MENEIKLTKLAKCAGCGAKVGAGVLAQLLEGLQVRRDPDLLVGFADGAFAQAVAYVREARRKGQRASMLYGAAPEELEKRVQAGQARRAVYITGEEAP